MKSLLFTDQNSSLIHIQKCLWNSILSYLILLIISSYSDLAVFNSSYHAWRAPFSHPLTLLKKNEHTFWKRKKEVPKWRGWKGGIPLSCFLPWGVPIGWYLVCTLKWGGGFNGYILTNLQKCALIRWITQSFVNNQLLIIVYFGEFKAG